VIILIIIAVFVLVGIIFGTLLTVLVVNKIIKRHVSLLERQANARTFMVADLNNPAQVAEADRQMSEGVVPLKNVVIEAPPLSIQQPSGKAFEYDYPTKNV